MSYAALDTYLLRGKAPWTFHHHADHTNLKLASDAPVIDYPKPDNIVSFDRNSSVYLSGTNHEENQPAHLQLKDSQVPIEHNLALYDHPNGVVRQGFVRLCGRWLSSRLQIAHKCAYKTCDIKIPLKIFAEFPRGCDGPGIPICKRIKASWPVERGHWITILPSNSAGLHV